MTEVVVGKYGVGYGQGLHSEVKKWTVTVGEVTSKFDYFKSFSGPFKPGERKTVAYNRVKNTGSAEGDVYIVWAELDSDGNVLRECRKSISVKPDECAGLIAVLRDDEFSSCMIRADDPNCRYKNDCDMQKSKAGTYYLGMKTWGEDEDEPSFAEASAAVAGRTVAEKTVKREVVRFNDFLPMPFPNPPIPRIIAKWYR